METLNTEKQSFLDSIKFEIIPSENPGEECAKAELTISLKRVFPSDINIPRDVLERGIRHEVTNFIHNIFYGEVFKNVCFLKQLIRDNKFDEALEMCNTLKEATYDPKFSNIVDPNAQYTLTLQ